MSMIQHNEQQSNEANKKQAAKSTNMNDDNRSMLHTFWGETSGGQYMFQDICEKEMKVLGSEEK